MNRRLALALFLLGVAAVFVFQPGDADAKNARLLDSSTIQKLRYGSPVYLGFMRSTDGGLGTSAGHVHTYVDAGSLPDGGDGTSSYYAVDPITIDRSEFVMVQCGEACYVMDGTDVTRAAADVLAGAYVAANERYYMLLRPGVSSVAMRTADGSAGVCAVFKME